jgi:hypothetical protein
MIGVRKLKADRRFVSGVLTGVATNAKSLLLLLLSSAEGMIFTSSLESDQNSCLIDLL